MKHYKILKTQSNTGVKFILIKSDDNKKLSTSDVAKQSQKYINERIRANGVANLSQRDKQYYNDYQSKLKQIQILPTLIKQYMNNYAVYYLTMTYEFHLSQTKQGLYEEYWKYFYRKLRQYAEKDRRDKSRKSIMLLVPEKSGKAIPTKANQNASKGLYIPNHYHGYILIHKDNLHKFQRKVISGYDENGLRVNHRILDPYSVDISRDIHRENLLSWYSYKITPVETEDDIFNTCYYNNKGILKSNFNYDDVLYYN